MKKITYEFKNGAICKLNAIQSITEILKDDEEKLFFNVIGQNGWGISIKYDSVKELKKDRKLLIKKWNEFELYFLKRMTSNN